MRATLTIRPEPADQPDVLRLIEALDAQMTALYPPASNHLLDIGALSDPASPFAFTLPAAEHFAAAAGHLGIGDGTHVIAYTQDAPMWATRLWWLLRYFGHDGTSVLDGVCVVGV